MDGTHIVAANYVAVYSQSQTGLAEFFDWNSRVQQLRVWLSLKGYAASGGKVWKK